MIAYNTYNMHLFFIWEVILFIVSVLVRAGNIAPWMLVLYFCLCIVVQKLKTNSV